MTVPLVSASRRKQFPCRLSIWLTARSQLIQQPLGRIPPCTCSVSQTLPEASKAQRDWHLVSLVQAGLIKQSIKYLSAL